MKSIFQVFAAAGVALVFAVSGGTPAQAKSPLSALAGSWSGGGSLRLADGRSERIRCRAYYTSRSAGNAVGLAIRCAATGYKIELRARLRHSNGRVSGSWSERTYNASGSVSGRASPGRLNVSIRGGVSGSMNLSFSKRRQRVSISTSTSNLRGVSISLSR